ncbi:hypothetical protein MTO96_022289 [Rhipicephalus appendiculatus]
MAATAAHSSAPFSGRWRNAAAAQPEEGQQESRNYRAAAAGIEGRKGRGRGTPLGARLTPIVRDAAFSL